MCFYFAVIFRCYFLCLVTRPAVYHRLLLTGAGGEGGGGWRVVEDGGNGL